MREVIIGRVKPFPDVKPDKEQALKPLEEAAEVLEAWKSCDESDLEPDIWTDTLSARRKLVDECCDVIQATCNLLASLGIHDVTGYMKDCELRNRERGRYAD